MAVTTIDTISSKPDFSTILSALSNPAKGLTSAEKDTMRQRIAGQGKTQLQNILVDLAGVLGGSSAAFGLNAARLKSGVGSSTAATMADVDVQQAEADRQAEITNRSQLLNLAGLQNQLYGMEINKGLANKQIDLSKWSTALSAIPSVNVTASSSGAGQAYKDLLGEAGVDLTSPGGSGYYGNIPQKRLSGRTW